MNRVNRVTSLTCDMAKCQLCDVVVVHDDVLNTIYDGLAQGLLESRAVTSSSAAAAAQRSSVSSFFLLLTWHFFA